MEVTQITKTIVGIVALSIILSGGTIPDKWFDMFGTAAKEDIQSLGGVMTIENKDNGDKCLLLTGSVVLNRVYRKSWKGDTIDEIITAKGQYASVTVNGYKTVKVPKRIKMLAKYLLIFGPICPSNVVYQSKNSKLGSGLYDKVPTPNEKIKYEYFCYE